MKVVLRPVLYENQNGVRVIVGYLPDDTEDVTDFVHVLEADDGTFWALAQETSITAVEDVPTAKEAVLRKAVIAKLSDKELAAIGVSRE